MGVVAKGTTKPKTTPVNLRSIKIKGRSGAVVSILKKNNHLYLIIVNKDYSGEITINITAKHNIPRYLTKELSGNLYGVCKSLSS